MADVPNLDLDATDGTEEFAKAIERMAEQDKLAAEAAERRKKAARELRDLYGDFATAIDKASKRNADLMRSMRDGTFSRQAREMAELNRQYERLRREAELTARFVNGMGGWLARNEKVMGAVGRVGSFAAGATLASGAGLVRQGFSGTVEEARLSRETKMLGRELAGAFIPVIDVTTRLTRSLRQFLEGLGPTGQNAVMAGGLALTGATAARFLGLGSAARALLTGGGTFAAAAATAGGSAVGGAAGGVAAAGAARGLGATLKGVARAVPYLGLGLTATDAATGGDYGRFRAAGKGRGAAFAASFGASLYDTYHYLAPWEDGPNPMDKARQDWDRKHGMVNGRRQVGVVGAGWDEPGEGFARLNSAISTVEAERGSKDPPAPIPAKVSDEGGGLLAELERAAADFKAGAADIKAAAERRDGPALKRPGG